MEEVQIAFEPAWRVQPLALVRSPLRYEDMGCLHELFEASADATPNAPALISPSRNQLTYRELDEQANRIARYLRRLGARPGKFVGLYFERSGEPIKAILGCLKAGAAYVPIDPVYPADRIAHIVEEAEMALVLTESALAAKAKEHFPGCRIIATDTEAEAIAGESADRLTVAETGLRTDDLAYVIYTSGTTGRPKGVMAEHRNAFKFALAFNEVCLTTPADRVYQGFSLGFDGSVEEMWLAFSIGSALVVADKETPKFGNELGQFLNRMGVTYFSTVPTLLSTITDSVASLKLLVVSGEICPAELVNRWANRPEPILAAGDSRRGPTPGLRMLNVYGPTEACVNTTAKECRAGEPVTIGKPLRGYDIHILDSEFRPVARGEKGELFVGGITLARGYLKREDLTREKFLDVNGERLYRTGDLVRWNEQGELDFFGRIDSQVKIRGYRVELAEIESLLLEHARIQTACVKLFDNNGLQELAAYVIVDDFSRPLDRAEVLKGLEARLPAYMIPGFLDVLPEFPMLTSGKVDKKQLPEPKEAFVRVGTAIVPPADAREATVAAAYCKVLRLPEVSVESDFFTDLGGHSLVAAQLVTTLREITGKNVTVRDAYNHPTARKLAERIKAIEEPELSAAKLGKQKRVPLAREVFESMPSWVPTATGLLQLVSFYVLAAILAVPAGVAFLYYVDWLEDRISLLGLYGYLVVLGIALWPTLLAVSIASKWLLVGRYKPGKHKLWSFYYFRFWFAARIQAMSGAGAFAGTPILPLYLRLMGAKVGKRCLLDTAAFSSFDLLSIGDDTSIGSGTQVAGYRVENGYLIIGGASIGSRCFVGIHSCLGLGARMEDDTRLDDQSLLPDHAVIPQGEGRRGSPAQKAEIDVPAALPTDRKRHPILWGLAHVIAADLLGIVFAIPGFGLIALWMHALLRDGSPALIAALVLSIPLVFAFYAVYFALMKRVIVNKAHPGEHDVESFFYLRKWLADGIVSASRALLLPLYTTMYMPPWMRLMGAKIGRRAELSTVWYFAPELMEVGEESFFADGSIVGGKRFFGGRFRLGFNRVGKRSFMGNSAILPVGKSLGDKCLLGVQSLPPAEHETTPNGTEWLGSPAFALPHRPKVGNFDDTVIFQPTRKLLLHRALIDGMRILLPSYIGMLVGIASLFGMWWLLRHHGLVGLFLLSPFLALAISVSCIYLVVALKNVVMGTFEPVIKPLWSPYVWLNEMVNGVYESIMAPALIPFLGTPFVAYFLRLMGCRIGKNTYLETTLFSEWDLVEIGDHAALNGGAVMQNHLFEDRIMKSSHLRVGDECTVGPMAIVLYDSEMKRGASLGPLSLLMKGETMAPLARWHGIPTVQHEEGSELWDALDSESTESLGELIALGRSELSAQPGGAGPSC